MADTTQLLDQLRDVQQPLPPEGVALWLIVANVSIAALIIALLWYRRQQQNNGWKKQLIGDLRRARQQPPQQALANTATVLRQLMLYRGQHVQTISGEPWLQALDDQFQTQWFTRGPGQVFGNELYQTGTYGKHRMDVLLDELERLVKSLPAIHKRKANSA